MHGSAIPVGLTGAHGRAGGAGGATRSGRSRDAAAAERERATEWLVVRSAVFVLLVGLAVLVVALLAWRLRVMILLIAVSLFIAVLLNPFVRMLCNRGG